ESWNEKIFAENGIDAKFVQDNHSLSARKGVLRGLHFQTPPNAQAKLVRVTQGKVFDVIVDLRKDSPTFGKWEGFEISADGFEMLFIPRGFAHAYCTLEDNTEFQYKVDGFYAPESDSGIIWNDPTLNIKWPIKDPILSEKDSKLQFFKDFNSPF
ncbi:MAG: dTDP-4-dehydrorhamnose 3,5-epimerase, partial [Candidatus Moranbacteria bacterium]|nr:dTDP-4-dehydrorhamnose 3,5-epimerase [Candidatus Moranbacteria bacterium]